MPVEPIDPIDPDYFTVAEFRAEMGKPFDDAVTYTDARIDAIRMAAEESFESTCHVAFVTRETTETVWGEYGLARLSWPLVQAVSAVTVDGTAWTAGEIADVEYHPVGFVYRTPSRYGYKRERVTVTYTHGHAQTPAEAKWAVMLITKRRLLDGPIDDRATTFSSQDGTFSLATPGRGGSIYGIPEVDRIVRLLSMQTGIA